MCLSVIHVEIESGEASRLTSLSHVDIFRNKPVENTKRGQKVDIFRMGRFFVRD